jgi:hypothetical protein
MPRVYKTALPAVVARGLCAAILRKAALLCGERRAGTPSGWRDGGLGVALVTAQVSA